MLINGCNVPVVRGRISMGFCQDLYRPRISIAQDLLWELYQDLLSLWGRGRISMGFAVRISIALGSLSHRIYYGNSIRIFYRTRYSLV